MVHLTVETVFREMLSVALFSTESVFHLCLGSVSGVLDALV